MAADKLIKSILKEIEGAVTNFQKNIPGIQKGMLDGVIEQLKDLSVQNGRVLNSVQNLKLIMQIKNRLEKLIVSEGYKESVKEFIKAFDTVAGLQQQYFADFNFKFKPSKTLPIIREASVDKTLNDLLGQGLQSNVVDKVHDVLLSNITTGGSYASLAEQLRNSILTNETGEGVMERYSKTITTDAINQYAAQYHDTLAQDLNLNWGRYIGSNLKTTREFCEKLTEKEWVHRTELPEILKGNIDGGTVKLNKQKLPLGMIPGTTPDNFKVRRGGYNCGHQFFWVPDSSVPEHIRANFGKPLGKKNDYDIAILKKGSYGNWVKSNQAIETIKGKHPELTKDEKMAVYGYTRSEYLDMNRYLREGKNDNPYFESYKRLLNTALYKMKARHEGWSFRGTNLSKTVLETYYNAYKSKAPLQHNDFISSSKIIGSSFEGTTKFSILSKNGKFIKDLSGHKHENEVLYKAGTLFKIISIREKDGITYIKMEEI